MSNLSSTRDHIFERFDRILEYLSSRDKISNYDRDSAHGRVRDRDRDRDRDWDRDKDRDRDRDRERYQHRYRERD